MNLLDSELRANVEQGFEDLFDSFARNLTFTAYKSPKETIVALDNSFNSDWVMGQSSIAFEEVKQTFAARMWYLDLDQQYKQVFFEGHSIENIKAVSETTRIKLQVKPDAFSFIKDASRIMIAGKSYEIISAPQGLGIFDFKYFTILLAERK